jgi:hypothetical protein
MPQRKYMPTARGTGRRWTNRQGAADHAGVSVRIIDSWTATGKLPAYRVPSSRSGRGFMQRIDLNDVDALIESDPVRSVHTAESA